jgi:hypothetical protein
LRLLVPDEETGPGERREGEKTKNQTKQQCKTIKKGGKKKRRKQKTNPRGEERKTDENDEQGRERDLFICTGRWRRDASA